MKLGDKVHFVLRGVFFRHFRQVISAGNTYIHTHVYNTVMLYYIHCISVQFSLVTQSCPTLCDPWTSARPASLSITNSQSLLKLMSIESVMPSNHFILCSPILLPPSIFPGNRVFSNKSVLCIRWPKYWSFSFNISPSDEYSGLISFRMDWLDLLAVQGSLKSIILHYSSKASIFQFSTFFIVQFSHPIQDYWKKHSFDQMDHCWQSNVSAF